MRLIDGKLYLEFQEMVECGVSENYLKKAKSTGTKCWVFMNDPADNRRVLIDFEALKDEYKAKVSTRFGNPYDLTARKPILDQVINRTEAHDYFLSYRYNGSKCLPIDVVSKYTRMDAWLTFLGKMTLGDIKRGFGLTVPEFYSHAGELIGIEKRRGEDKSYTGVFMLPGDFPTSYQRLKNRADLYKKQSFQDLIHPLYGNKNASKVGRLEGGFCPEIAEKQMAVIRTVAGKHNNFDAAQVAQYANAVFQQNGWSTLSRSRIYQVMQENMIHLTPGRRGKRVYQNEMAMQIKRSAPKFPMYYWTLDGWTVELLYKDETGYNNRLVAVIVQDPFNKYIVGYAIGDRENTELIKKANRNALTHVAELFGDMYKPLQVQSDHYGIKQMTPFYQAIAHTAYTPAAVGNAKSKIIEPYFKDLNKRRCQPQPNWSGFNITSSKKNQVNTEFLNLIKNSFPDREGCIAQIEAIIAKERAERVDEYVAAWQTVPEDKKVLLMQEEWMRIFGQQFERTSSITGQGVIKTIDGVQYTYDSFDPVFRANRHLNWNIFADPHDHSKVLAESEDGKLRFILEEKLAIPMDITSQTEEHHAYRGKVSKFNKEQEERIMNRYAQDAEIIEDIFSKAPLTLSDAAEAAQKLMFTTKAGQQKEGIQDAKGLKKAQKLAEKQKEKEESAYAETWAEQQRRYLESKTDISSYL